LEVDSFLLIEIDSFLVNDQIEWQKFQEISRRFCFLKYINKEKTDQLLRLCLNSQFSSLFENNLFFVRNFRCFDKNQNILIRKHLRQFLKPNDPFFHELVSLFQLQSKRKYLENDQFTKALFKKLKTDLTDGQIEDSNLVEIKNLASLANLGDLYIEDSLIIMVNDMYSHVKKLDNTSLVAFYYDIVPNSIGLLQSKRSVLETFYMLDEEQMSPFEYYDDVGDYGYASGYFFSCVVPKLNGWKIQHLARMDFQKNKEQIKKLIIDDNSIWLDHIRIDDK